MSDKPIPWITEWSPSSNDTSAKHHWCVQIIDRSGPLYAMRWDDAELQDFPAKTTCVVAWRPFGSKTEGGAV